MGPGVIERVVLGIAGIALVEQLLIGLRRRVGRMRVPVMHEEEERLRGVLAHPRYGTGIQLLAGDAQIQMMPYAGIDVKFVAPAEPALFPPEAVERAGGV